MRTDLTSPTSPQYTGLFPILTLDLGNHPRAFALTVYEPPVSECPMVSQGAVLAQTVTLLISTFPRLSCLVLSALMPSRETLSLLVYLWPRI